MALAPDHEFDRFVLWKCPFLQSVIVSGLTSHLFDFSCSTTMQPAAAGHSASTTNISTTASFRRLDQAAQASLLPLLIQITLLIRPARKPPCSLPIRSRNLPPLPPILPIWRYITLPHRRILLKFYSASIIPALSLASRDLHLLLSTLESVAGVASSPQLRSQPKSPLCHQDLFGTDEIDSLNIPPSLGTRAVTPFEACYLYAQGKFQSLDVPVEGNPSLAILTHACAALRLAQTLTVVSSFDYTFSLAHPSARDLMMIDAFLRDDIYLHLRDSLVEGASVPSSSAHTYPCIRDFPCVSHCPEFKRFACRNPAAYHSSDRTVYGN
ncbi:hypothetical protein Y032_0019g3818 [Ancylostoma ceylanicum]|uniref:Uncharacterized protein n=1 Tax=Ancylostoma ceylanicum TaxID=53326 RepID=A0A016V185_9BILA|nr:hypothetical protein Y032_0019g3818 [Ancylostoma ceylanicum]